MTIARLVAVFILIGSSQCQVHKDVKIAAYDEFPHQVYILVTYENRWRSSGPER